MLLMKLDDTPSITWPSTKVFCWESAVNVKKQERAADVLNQRGDAAHHQSVESPQNCFVHTM
jgi:hypothetical protein